MLAASKALSVFARPLPTVASTIILAAVACNAPPKPVRPQPIDRGHDAPPPIASVLDAQTIVDDILRPIEDPAAVAVLSVAQRKPIAMGKHLGADPASLAARPGSTVKPILAWLAAEAATLHPHEPHPCSGESTNGFHCFASHGTLELPDAIAKSCNSYAFEVANKLGFERIATGFSRFGLGRRTGLVSAESAGWVADPAWAKSPSAAPAQRWDLLVGTGHGPIEVTPLQLALAYWELLKRLATPDLLPEDSLREEISEGLRRVVASDEGTGRAAALAKVSVGGKTGTAESGTYGAEAKGDANSNVVTPRQPAAENAWFVGFAPFDEPQVIVVVIVVGGGSGSKVAAPLAGRIFAGLLPHPA